MLMRSCYEAVDDLDFVPMDRYQIQFWKRRAAEQEAYLALFRGRPQQVSIGQLSEPQYFDFVSWTQMLATASAMAKGLVEFEELDPEAPGRAVLVRRPAGLEDNASLPLAFRERAGELLLDKMRGGFEGLECDVPEVGRGDPPERVLEKCRRLLANFERFGYARSIALAEGDVGAQAAEFTVTVEGAATQWGLQNQALQRQELPTAHDALALVAFLRQSGYACSYLLRPSSERVVEEWSIERV